MYSECIPRRRPGYAQNTWNTLGIRLEYIRPPSYTLYMHSYSGYVWNTFRIRSEYMYWVYPIVFDDTVNKSVKYVVMWLVWLGVIPKHTPTICVMTDFKPEFHT